MTKKKPATIDFLWAALFAFAGFALEILLSMVEPDWPGWTHSLVTSLLWGVAIIGLLLYAKNTLAFDIWQFKARPSVIQIIILAVLGTATVISVSILWECFRPIIEYKNQGSLFSFICQYIYYLFESALIAACIVFAQEFFERITNLRKIPWGGCFLAITWGLMHILTQGLQTGIAAFAWAIVYGLVYVLCNKNIRYAYPIIAILFIL